jgi:peptide/nickel transport system permease protein
MSKKQRALLKYAVIRIIMTIPVLFFITLIVFVMLSLAPGDPVFLMLGTYSTVQRAEELREELGLNNPVLTQYWNFLKKLILHGDLGRSYQSGKPVIDEIKRTLPVSAQLAINGMLISAFVAILLGVISAIKQYSLVDNVTKIAILAGVSMPIFWLGLILILIFSVYFEIFPSFGWGGWKHMVLPSLTIAAYPLAILSRLTRSSMLEVIRQDYIRTARAKGLSENVVIFKHALRNASIPVVTMIGVQFGVLISGSILTETVFAIPGLGMLMVNSIFYRDYTVIRGGILVSASIFAIINLIVDLSYSILDPRIKY